MEKLKKRSIFTIALLLTVGLTANCGTKTSDYMKDTSVSISSLDSASVITSSSSLTSQNFGINNDTALNKSEDLSAIDKTSLDKSSQSENGFAFLNGDITSDDIAADYTEDIKNEIDKIAASGYTMEEEIAEVKRLSDKFDKLAEAAGTQYEMNITSVWYFVIWDSELNSIWQRMNQATKDTILEEERVWIKNRDRIAEIINEENEKGSIFSLLVNTDRAMFAENRSYILASLYAKDRGEKFELPQREAVGNYLSSEDDSTLLIKYGMEAGSIDALLTITDKCEIAGKVTGDGDKLHFESNDGYVTGTIEYSWDGAVFKVDQSNNENLPANSSYMFDMAL